MASVNHFAFACPSCRAPLESAAPDVLRCPADGATFSRRDGVWRMLAPERAAAVGPFLRDYVAIRQAEGYGYDDPVRYRRLPEPEPGDPLAWQWRMRARSFAVLRRHVLSPFTPCPSPGGRRAGAEGGLRILDLGAGNGWLSNRLAQLGHYSCAIDLNLDPCDGLQAARHYQTNWPAIQAEFDRLPLAEAQADLAIYNASMHYSADYRTTLAEALRVLRPGGRIVILDSPIYRRDASGRQMVAERQAAFVRQYGTRSDSLPSVGYLTWAMLDDLERELRLRWRIFRPWYGWGWAWRPCRARLLRKREPSTFALLVAERA
jgi:SAM-dependent methyltransferase